MRNKPSEDNVQFALEIVAKHLRMAGAPGEAFSALECSTCHDDHRIGGLGRWQDEATRKRFRRIKELANEYGSEFCLDAICRAVLTRDGEPDE